MNNLAYFQMQDNLFPRKAKARIAKWRKAHPDRVRKATRLRVARFRARKG